MEKINSFTILRPAGNDQLLINGIVEKKYRREINDAMIRQFPNVEQVSFYEFNKKNNIARLELAGGEFCGNATRSLAYLLLKGKPGKILLQVSGTTNMLSAGVNASNTAFAQMPIFNNFTCVQQLQKDLFRVDLEGISHLICTKKLEIKKNKDLVDYAKKLLEKNNLLFSIAAAGVMFIEINNNKLLLKPVVWVKNTQTILYETCCASGTAAVALWYALQNNKSITNLQIKQPSNFYLNATVRKDSSQFIDLFIDGPIELIRRKESYE